MPLDHFPGDTSPEMQEVYYRRLAELGPAERIRIGVGMWQAAQAMQRAAILREHPQADEDEIRFRMAVSRFGPELARAAWRRS